MSIVKLAFLVLQLLLVRATEDIFDFEVKINADYIHGAARCPSPESTFLVQCDISYPQLFKFIPQVPLVEFFYRKTSEDPYLNLYDDLRFLVTKKQRKCSKLHNNATDSYVCKYMHAHSCSPSYDGEYMCKINAALSDGNDRVYNASNYLVGASHSDEKETTCFIPNVTALRARLSSNNSIFLDWDTTTAPPGKIYCDRSRRFSVKVFTYDTFSRYRQNQTSFVSDFVDTAMRRETNFTLPLSDQYTVDKFYIFQIRNQYLRGRVEDGIVLQSTILYPSEVFYFGSQELLDLVKPSRTVEKKSVLLGNPVILECEAAGFPLPTTTMWFENNLIEPSRSSRRVPAVSRTVLASANVAGRYQCNAVGYYLSPEGGAFLHSAVKFIDLEVYEEDSDTDLLCTTPGQTQCNTFFYGQHVLLNMTQQNTNFPAFIDESVSKLDEVAATSSAVEARCLRTAQAVMCHSSYPFCFDHDNYRKVCKVACDLFRSGGPCAKTIDSQRFPGVLDMMLSNCDNRTDSAGEFPECIHVPFDNDEESQEPSWCNVGKGTSYAGSVRTTTSGYLCQDWTVQSPHQHVVYPGADIFYATKQCRNPQGRGTRPWCYTSETDVRWEYCDDVPQCEICTSYTETFCKELPGYNESGLVYVNQHELEWDKRGLDGAELWMIRAWHNLKVMEFNLSSNCLLGLKELICHKTVPLCSSSSQGTAAASSMMKLCSDHCRVSKLLQVCPGNLFSKIEAAMQSNSVTFSKLECSVDTMENRNTCLTSQAFLLATAVLASEDDTCYEADDRGRTYNGTVAVAQSGKACQPWGSLLPGAKSYCRNPGQVASRPWCYIDNTTWEYCDVPVCKNNIITEPLLPTRSSGYTDFTISMTVLFILVGVSIIIGGICFAICIGYAKNRKMRKGNIKKINPVGTKWGYVRNAMYHQVAEPSSPTKTAKLMKVIKSFPQFDKESIHYVRQIGQGNFGVVFYATAEGVQPDEKVTQVAVKTLKAESCTEALEDFVREAKLMFSFNHENVVKIYGVSMEVPYYLVCEYMGKGDLAQFLRSNASSAQRRLMYDSTSRSRTESTLSNDPPSLCSEQLADICKQIACGMKYLAGENHIHRDLACRNCLVKSSDDEQTESGLVIKIGDFGMSHNLYNSDYYRVKGSAVLPVRWMSPEAILYGKFSTESDVWSFGVVMWEVFSFATQPYYGTSNEEVTEAIRRHKILKQPTHCSSSMYEIMKQCWNQEPRLRPSFAELYNQLDEFRGSVSSGGSPSIDYFNSNSSDLDSDAFLEENSVDEFDAAL